MHNEYKPNRFGQAVKREYQSRSSADAKALNNLLSGELSAVEAYSLIIDRSGDEPEMKPLKRIKLDHQEAVNDFHQEVREREAAPAADSGVWGSAVKLFLQSARILGNKAALQALQQGELRGEKIYGRVLLEGEINPIVQERIRNKYIPRQRQHVEVLEKLIQFNV